MPLPTAICKVVVRGNEKKGEPPYIELDHARYRAKGRSSCDGFREGCSTYSFAMTGLSVEAMCDVESLRQFQQAPVKGP